MEYEVNGHGNHKYKVVLVGDSGVGKSNLHSRFMKNSFYASHIPTIGVDYGVRSVDLGDHVIKLNVWDTAGQERFHALTNRLYMKGARGVMFVYDITRYESFENIRKWITLVEKCDSVDASLEYMLVGNKSDLKDERTVPMREARNLADRKSMLFMETSALEGDSATAAFRLLAAEIHRKDISRSLRSLDLSPSYTKEHNNNTHQGPVHDSSISLHYSPPSETKCC